METLNLYLGDRLGWLDALAEAPATAAEFAEREAGVADRASFTVAEGEALGDLGPFGRDLRFRVVHDMPRPVEVLAAIHDAVRSDGLVVIMDEAVAEDFTAPGDPVEQVMYGYSTLICLPKGLSSTPLLLGDAGAARCEPRFSSQDGKNGFPRPIEHMFPVSGRLACLDGWARRPQLRRLVRI